MKKQIPSITRSLWHHALRHALLGIPICLESFLLLTWTPRIFLIDALVVLLAVVRIGMAWMSASLLGFAWGYLLLMPLVMLLISRGLVDGMDERWLTVPSLISVACLVISMIRFRSLRLLDVATVLMIGSLACSFLFGWFAYEAYASFTFLAFMIVFNLSIYIEVLRAIRRKELVIPPAGVRSHEWGKKIDEMEMTKEYNANLCPFLVMYGISVLGQIIALCLSYEIPQVHVMIASAVCTLLVVLRLLR